MQLVPADATDAQVNISLLVGTAGMTPSTMWPLLAHRLDVFVAEVRL